MPRANERTDISPPIAIGLVASSGSARVRNEDGDEVSVTGRSLVIFSASSGRVTTLPLARLVSSEMFPPIARREGRETRTSEAESILNVRFEDHTLQLSFLDVRSLVDFMRMAGLV